MLALAVALPVGIYSAVRRNTLMDHAATVIVFLGQSMPVFWIGIMLMLLFAVQWRVLPVSGWGSWASMVLPAVTLGAFTTPLFMRIIRSSMLEVINLDYVRTARAKGVSEWLVICRHALRNAALPIVTVIGLQFGLLLGGAVLTETVFAVPGVGRLIVGAIRQLDLPVVQAGRGRAALAPPLPPAGVAEGRPCRLSARHRPGRARRAEPDRPRRAYLAARRRGGGHREPPGRRHGGTGQRIRRRKGGHRHRHRRRRHAVVPADPARARLRGRPGTEPRHHHRGARAHGLGALHACGAGGGDGPAREGVHRGGASDRRGPAAHHLPARPAQHGVLDRGDVHAPSRAGDPGGGGAVVPRRGLGARLPDVGPDDLPRARLRDRRLVAPHPSRARDPPHRARDQPRRRPVA